MKSNVRRAIAPSTSEPWVVTLSRYFPVEAEYRQWKATLASSDRAYLERTERLPSVGGGNLEEAEALLASGVRKGDGGKHVAADLLVSRRGFRRVIPDNAGLDVEASELQELARTHLTGRIAAVFDAFVLRPLLTGDARASVESLAADFGVSQRRIYKDLVRAQRQLSDAWRLLLDEEAKRVLGDVRAFQDDLAARRRQFEELTRADSSLKDFSPSSYVPEGFTRVSYQRSSSPWPVIGVLFVMPSIRGRFAITPSTAVKGLRLSYSPIFTTATGYTTAVNTSATAVSSATTKYFSP